MATAPETEPNSSIEGNDEEEETAAGTSSDDSQTEPEPEPEPAAAAAVDRPRGYGTLSNSLGDTVSDNTLATYAVSRLEMPGMVVGLLFIAYWCGPSRDFLRNLVHWWSKAKTKNKGKTAVILFSPDGKRLEYQSFTKQVPRGFYHIPFGNGHGPIIARRMASKYGVTLVPSLVFIDGYNGDVVYPNGRQLVESDPLAKRLTWRPPDIRDLFIKGHYLEAPVIPPENPEEKVTYDMVVGECLLGKHILLYFGSSKSHLCQDFEKLLKKTEKRMKERNEKFAIVYVNADRNPGDFQNNFYNCLWLAVPHDDDRREFFANYYHIRCIPRLVVLGLDLRIITTEGVSCINHDPLADDFPWQEEPVMELTERYEQAINTKQCVICFTDGSSQQRAIAMKLLSETAELIFMGDVLLDEDWDVQFLYTGTNVEIRNRLQKVIGMRRATAYPYIVVLDLACQRLWAYDDVMTSEQVHRYLKQVFEGTIASKTFAAWRR
eukprot:scpid57207/ scgid9557/ Nucleoredoxin